MSLDIFTIGHSTHEFAVLLEILRRNGVTAVADVRSSPFSGRAPQFNRPVAEKCLKQNRVAYVYLGDLLGGRPSDDAFYDAAGYALYWRMADSRSFAEGLERVMKGAEKHRIALMCSEEDPSQCHRHLLVSRVLHARGVGIRHLRGDGSAIDAASIPFELSRQSSLFDNTWRSAAPVRRPTN